MSQKKPKITIKEVRHLARLANLPLSDYLLGTFTHRLADVLTLVDHIKTLDTQGVAETAQVTRLTNKFRPDVVDRSRLLTPKEALKNAKRSYRGYFLIKSIF